MTRLRHLAADAAPVVTAPDGSRVRVLLDAAGRGGMALFELDAGEVAAAVVHATVDELWFVHAGRGRLWRQAPGEATGSELALSPGVCAEIPCGTRFQFRADDDGALVIVGTTMPPWPGPDEARVVDGPWRPTGSASS